MDEKPRIPSERPEPADEKSPALGCDAVERTRRILSDEPIHTLPRDPAEAFLRTLRTKYRADPEILAKVENIALAPGSLTIGGVRLRRSDAQGNAEMLRRFGTSGLRRFSARDERLHDSNPFGDDDRYLFGWEAMEALGSAIPSPEEWSRILDAIPGGRTSVGMGGEFRLADWEYVNRLERIVGLRGFFTNDMGSRIDGIGYAAVDSGRPWERLMLDIRHRGYGDIYEIRIRKPAHETFLLRVREKVPEVPR